MSSVTSTASFMQKNDSEKKCKKPSQNRELERTQKEKAVMMMPELTKDEAQTAIESLKKVKQVTTMEFGQKTSRHATARRRR